SKNENTTSVRLRVRFLQYTIPRFASIPTLLLRQIRHRCVHPYNASNTKTNLPNPASCSILMEIRFYVQFLSFLLLHSFGYLKPKPRHSQVVVARLRLVSISQLLVSESVNVCYLSSVAIHSHKIQGMALPNNVDERKQHHANDNLLWLFQLRFFL